MECPFALVGIAGQHGGMAFEDALNSAKELMKAKRPTSYARRDELVAEWQETVGDVKSAAEELTALAEALEEAISDMEEAEREDFAGFTDTIRNAAEEVRDALT